MSIASSNASGITVSCYGEDDVDFDRAVDRMFSELQQCFNNTHCGIRELGGLLEKEDDFTNVVDKSVEIYQFVSDIEKHFIELKSVIKQVVGKPQSPEEKAYLKEKMESIKTKRAVKVSQNNELNQFMQQ